MRDIEYVFTAIGIAEVNIPLETPRYPPLFSISPSASRRANSLMLHVFFLFSLQCKFILSMNALLLSNNTTRSSAFRWINLLSNRCVVIPAYAIFDFILRGWRMFTNDRRLLFKVYIKKNLLSLIKWTLPVKSNHA